VGSRVQDATRRRDVDLGPGPGAQHAGAGRPAGRPVLRGGGCHRATRGGRASRRERARLPTRGGELVGRRIPGKPGGRGRVGLPVGDGARRVAAGRDGRAVVRGLRPPRGPAEAQRGPAAHGGRRGTALRAAHPDLLRRAPLGRSQRQACPRRHRRHRRTRGELARHPRRGRFTGGAAPPGNRGGGDRRVDRHHGRGRRG
jgi:hypothetical protein